MILLHGYPDNLQMWSRLAPLLASSFQVIAFDWPGMGYSDRWKGGATPFHMAERLYELLDAWKIGKANIAGVDMGGQPALAFASRYPERALSVIVMNSLVQWNESTSWEIAVLRKFGWNRFALRHLPRLVFNRAIATSLSPNHSLDGTVRSDMWESFRRREVREFIVRMCAGYQGSLAGLATYYASIRTRTLVLWAEHDKHFPLPHARRLHGALPDARLEIVRDGDHWMPLSLPSVVASHILEFTRPPNQSS
jgi:pimeloyl-ACP methyl ester carboxylesterase